MREEIIRLLQRQYRVYRDFLIDIDRAKEVEEQNTFIQRCLDCYCEADADKLCKFDMDNSIDNFYKNHRGMCSTYYEDQNRIISCRFLKQGEDIVLSCVGEWDYGCDYDYETNIIFKEQDFLDFCLQREDWNYLTVVDCGKESILNQHKVFRQGYDEVLFTILKELCSIIIEFDKSRYIKDKKGQ